MSRSATRATPTQGGDATMRALQSTGHFAISLPAARKSHRERP